MIAVETEHMNPWVKALFILVVLCMFLPVIWNILKTTTFNQRQRSYDRQRNRKIKPVGTRRYNHLWVVDRERTDEDAGITVYVRQKDEE